MISLVQKYLNINNFSGQKSLFEDLFQSHPDYPSLFAITDTLDLLSIENLAIKVLKEQLFELPDSFLAFYNNDLVLVTKNSSFIKVESEKGEKKNLSFDEFITGWNGIVIAIEPNIANSKESIKSNFGWLFYSLPVIALVILSLFYNSYGVIESILFLTSIVGLVFSIFIVQEKLGVKNEIVSKFCNINPNTSCNSVISSDKGEINKWLSFSDLPVLFFSINVVSILLNPFSSSNIVGLLSLISLPVIIYSIWVQKMQLKKWCLLCLAISVLIILQSVVWFTMGHPFVYISLPSLFSYLFAMILITSFWLTMSPILVNKIKAEKEVSELKKFKRNYAVLNFLSKKIPVLKGLNKLEGLRFGNTNAHVRLMIILSPSCGHCHKAFKDALELVSRYPERIFLNILFNINPENNDNPYKVVVERLLEIRNSNEDLAIEAISDWHIKKIGLEKWLEKWKVDSISMKVNQQIELQYNWCRENEFNYTPVKMVNNKLFPNEYDISELKYFLNDYSEEKEAVEKSDLIQL